MKKQGQTDQVKKIELPSSIQQVLWAKQKAVAGSMVGIEVFTHYVGNLSDINIEPFDQSGKKLGKYKDKISGNRFWANIKIPDNAKDVLYAKVKLPKHGLEMQSNPLFILPPIEITNLTWDKEEAREGDVVKLTADIKGTTDGSEAMIEIWEYDADGTHDLIAKFSVFIEKGKIDVDWEYVYYEDRDEIPTQEDLEKYGKEYNPPEYFFTVTVHETKVGQQQESGLLTFRDWIEVKLTNGFTQVIENEPYILYLPDGNTIEGNTDREGTVKKEKIPPGKAFIEFPAYFNVYEVDEGHIEMVGESSSILSEDETESSDEKAIDRIDQRELKNDDVEYKEYDGEDEEDYDDEFLTPSEEDDEHVRGIFTPIFETDIDAKSRDEYEIASNHCITGRKYHLAVIYHISIELVDDMGETIGEPIFYTIRDQNGQVITDGTSDERGLIQHGGVGIGYYELVIDNDSLWIPSVPDLLMKQVVILKDDR